MAKERQRQEVKSSFAKPWKPEQVGDEMEGTYQGSEMVTHGKRTFESYKILTDGGELLGVSSAMLATKFNQVPVGAYVWVKFVGEVETNNGTSRDYHVDVEKGTELVNPFAKGQKGDLTE